MNCKGRIEEYFEQLPKGEIVLASRLYGEKFVDCSETSFFKTMERLVQSGFLKRISKGIYTKQVEYQEHGMNHEDIKSNVDAVLNHYFGENNDNGMFIGYHLYFKYGISNVKKDMIELYSNILSQENKNIANINIRRVDIELSYDNAKVIEALEILQNYETIEKINQNKAAKYLKQFARSYSNESTVFVLSRMKYKKRTIAFMKSILDMYGVDHTLETYLSCASTYKIPKVAKV